MTCTPDYTKEERIGHIAGQGIDLTILKAVALTMFGCIAAWMIFFAAETFSPGSGGRPDLLGRDRLTGGNVIPCLPDAGRRVVDRLAGQ